MQAIIYYCKEYRIRVEVGAKTTPTSTLFIYMLGSKAMGSSLTSQIAAKSAANCDARLKNILLLICPICFFTYPLCLI